MVRRPPCVFPRTALTNESPVARIRVAIDQRRLERHDAAMMIAAVTDHTGVPDGAPPDPQQAAAAAAAQRAYEEAYWHHLRMRQLSSQQQAATVTTVLFGPFGIAGLVVLLALLAVVVIGMRSIFGSVQDKLQTPCVQSQCGIGPGTVVTFAPMPTFSGLPTEWWGSDSSSDQPQGGGLGQATPPPG